MRRRLIVVFAAVTSMVAIAFIVPLCVFVRDVARERALDDAARDASALFPLLAVNDDPNALAIGVSRTAAGSGGRLTVYESSGVIAGAPVAPDATVNDALTRGQAFSGRVDGGEAVVSPVIRADGSIAVVRVFVSEASLTEGVRSAWLTLSAVGAALVLGSVLLADRLARSLTAPVTALADASHRLAEGDLTARVAPAGPREIEDVGRAFNHLAGRVDELLRAEREDVADIAHRLRTPLTALRLQLDQVADTSVRAQLGDSADDLSRSLDAVIGQARRHSRDVRLAECDLALIVAERAAFWSALAEDQGRPARVTVAAEPVTVQLVAEDAQAFVDVLIENVYAHTPDGTPYGIDLRVVDDVAVLTVVDRGPGFRSEDVVTRGSSATSTGLGLDIARRAALDAGGTFDVGTPVDGGAVVTVRLPVVRHASR